jgi:hypothetical protein
MPAASPRRQASPVDMTLTSARTTRRRRGATLAGLGSNSLDEDEKAAAAARETALRYIEAAAGTKALARPGAQQRQPAGESDPVGRVAAPGGGGGGGGGGRRPLGWVPVWGGVGEPWRCEPPEKKGRRRG